MATKVNKGHVIESIDREQGSSFDRLALDADKKQELEVLRRENSRLKDLVVRLSETVIKNVTNRK
jgi:hypothetical protein